VAALYVVDLQTGELIKRIVADGPARPLTSSECNGLSTPALQDTNLDGVLDYAYAGDLLGNLWKFDLTDPSPSQWEVYYRDATSTPQPLFQAKSRQGHRQPITIKPIVTKPCVFNGKGSLIIFGTGRFVGEVDLDDVSTQTLYGIWDWGPAWEKAYTDAGLSDPQGNARRAYLGSFEDVMDSTELAACQASCQDECENSGNVLCDAFATDCEGLCIEDETVCVETCGNEESTCQSTCLADLDTCSDACDPSAAGDPCRTACLADQVTCNDGCAATKATCESGCGTSRTSCEASCSSEQSACYSTVSTVHCSNAITAGDRSTCDTDCSTAYTTCLVAAGADAGLQQECQEELDYCATACISYYTCESLCGDNQRQLSNVANIPYFNSTTKAKYVTLLEQSQIYAGGINYYKTGDRAGEIEEIVYNPDNWRDYDYYIRVLTDYQPNWFDFKEWRDRRVTYPDELTHAGWYYDLTLTGERQISDMLLAGGFTVFNSVIPSRSPCESGGNTFGQALDYCSGGNVDTAFYDLNGDGIIDENDMIDIGSPGNPRLVGVVGILNDGINPTPAWLIGQDGFGVLLNPDHSDDGAGTGTGGTDPNTPEVPGVGEIGTESPGYGMYFWRELGR
ncbi:MAG: hypothetical protein IH612_19760, partial [Desulfofustis sp.]|nr:hypothetical protein [Desulfofustis sp.]